MSTLMLALLTTTAQATEFQVGAGLEAIAWANQTDANAELGHVEVDGLLSLGSVEVRADLDVMTQDRSLHPEWGAVLVGVNSWRFAAGFSPLPTGREHVDPWHNATVPYSAAFQRLYAGGLLGLRGQYDTGALSVQAWGGAGDDFTQPAFGGGVLWGDALRLGLDATAFPTQQRLYAHAFVTAPIQNITQLSAEGFYGGGDLAFVGTVELLPQAKVVPVVRGEFNSKSARVTPWVIDAGVRVSPLESIRVTFTGRAVQDQWWGFVSLNLVDVADNEGWRL